MKFSMIAAAVLAAALLPFASLAAIAPRLSSRCAARPAILLRDGEQLEAGTAFEVNKPGGGVVVLTALHLFGPEGGLRSDLPPGQLPDLVEEFDLYSMDYGHRLGRTGKGLSRSGYPFPSRGADCRGDLAVFSAPEETGLAPLSLAKADSPVGSHVWLVGKAYGDAGAAPVLYFATVTEERPDATVILLNEPLDTRGMSGSPVVDNRGELIGMDLGWQEIDGVKHLLLNPVSSIRAHLRAVR